MSALPDGAAALPEGLTAGRNVEPTEGGRAYAREVLLGLLGLFVLAALFGVFGQRPTTSVATGDAATLEVEAPAHLRGGLLFQSRFTIAAARELRHARLVLAPGWFEGMQVNSITPDPAAQRSDASEVVFELGRIPAGRTVVTVMQFQVDPTNVGRRSQDVRLEADGVSPLDVRRTVTVFP